MPPVADDAGRAAGLPGAGGGVPPAPGGRARAGQALLELALLAATLLTLMVGLVQLTLYLHAQGVVRGACQEGARVASAGPEDRLADGVAYAVDLVAAGLGRSAAGVTVTGTADADILQRPVPVARVVYQKERFRVAP